MYEKEEFALKKTLQKLYQDREMYEGDFNGYVKAHDAASAKVCRLLVALLYIDGGLMSRHRIQCVFAACGGTQGEFEEFHQERPVG